MAFPILAQSLAKALRPELRRAELDHDALSRPLAVCQLETCRATCCHDGVVLDPVEHQALAEVAQHRRTTLSAMGLDTAGPLFVPCPAARHKTKTATIPASPDRVAADFPAHFPPTRCVFLDTAHRCVWQRLAMAEGKHPWHYKPVSCWMHPLSLQPPSSPRAQPRLTLAGNPEDPEDFASATPCGRRRSQGEPAAKALSEELRLLGEIAGRDFLAELGLKD
jgi:hypothetical protein